MLNITVVTLGTLLGLAISGRFEDAKIYLMLGIFGVFDFVWDGEVWREFSSNRSYLAGWKACQHTNPLETHSCYYYWLFPARPSLWPPWWMLLIAGILAVITIALTIEAIWQFFGYESNDETVNSAA